MISNQIFTSCMSRKAQLEIFNIYLSRIEAAMVDALPVPSPPAFKSSILAIFRTFKFFNGMKTYYRIIPIHFTYRNIY